MQNSSWICNKWMLTGSNSEIICLQVENADTVMSIVVSSNAYFNKLNTINQFQTSNP